MPFFPLSHGFIANLTPVMIFFWAIYLPQFCPMLFVFACGLFIDIMMNGILGTHSFLLIIIYFIAVRLNEILQSLPLYFQILAAFVPVSVIFTIELLYMLIALSDQHHGLFLTTKYIITLCTTVPLWLLLRYMFFKLKDG